MEPNLDPEEWLRRNGTFWCPRLRLRARPGFCEALKRRPALSFHINSAYKVSADWGGDGRPLRPAACDGCPGPEGLEGPVERRVRRLLEVHKAQEPEPPTGREIRRLRMRLGMTQSQLAKKLRVSPQLVCMWEHGKIKVRGEYLEQLLKLEKGA
jgi:DNA-binding transcriptional regulator YiaG